MACRERRRAACSDRRQPHRRPRSTDPALPYRLSIGTLIVRRWPLPNSARRLYHMGVLDEAIAGYTKEEHGVAEAKAYLSITARDEVQHDHAKTAAEIWKRIDNGWWNGPDDPKLLWLR